MVITAQRTTIIFILFRPAPIEANQILTFHPFPNDEFAKRQAVIAERDTVFKISGLATLGAQRTYVRNGSINVM